MANKELFSRLSDFLSEEASIRYCLLAESALIKAHAQFSSPQLQDLTQELDALIAEIDPAEVYEEEAKTHHNIRALVNVLKRHIPQELSPFVHLGATSVDILDTSMAMRIRDSARKVVLPLMMEIENILLDIAEREAETPQVGRTHGQHAVPITFGYAVSEYVARFGKCIAAIEEYSNDLRGKLAGAVGAYNSTTLLVKDPVEFEKYFLSQLGLKPSEYATQMVEPEYLLRLLTEINIAFGILANIADDLRNLQRSEIQEIQELFTSDQVGSSTMPQKRNPWNSEHIKSLWKAFSPRVMTFYMDQISEHQRDLTNSASSRFIAEYISGFTAALGRMKKVLSTLHVFSEKMRKNLLSTGDFVLAEAAYILLAAAGETEGHEIIRKATLEAEKSGKRMVDTLKENPSLYKSLSEKLLEITGIDPEKFFTTPELYRGKSVEKTRTIVEQYKSAMSEIEEKL